MDSQKGKRGLGWAFRVLVANSRGAAVNNKRLLRLVIYKPVAEIFDLQIFGHSRLWGLGREFRAFQHKEPIGLNGTGPASGGATKVKSAEIDRRSMGQCMFGFEG